MVGSLSWHKYTSDDGTVYAVFLDKSNALAMGFEVAAATDPKLPQGMKMRKVNAKSSTTVRGKSLPVPATDSEFWDGTTNAVTINVGGAATEVFNITSRIGEKRTRGVSATDTGITT